MEALYVLKHTERNARLLEIVGQHYLLGMFIMSIAHEDSMIMYSTRMWEAIAAPIVAQNIMLFLAVI